MSSLLIYAPFSHSVETILHPLSFSIFNQAEEEEDDAADEEAEASQEDKVWPSFSSF